MTHDARGRADAPPAPLPALAPGRGNAPTKAVRVWWWGRPAVKRASAAVTAPPALARPKKSIVGW